jgi:hypothetical protein
MEEYILYIAAFVAGTLVNALWGHLYGLGSSIIMVKTAMTDSLLILTKNIQTVHEIGQLKVMALEIAGKGEKAIAFQKSVNSSEISSLKNTVIRNYINCVPPKYNHLVAFHNWDTAMEYLNNELQKEQS